MALPTTTVAEAAVQSLFDALSMYKTRNSKGRDGVAALQVVKAALREAYKSRATVTITDSTDASPTAAFLAAGQVGLALGRKARVGDIFVTAGGTADFTDNALATAKGSGVATGDMFVVLTLTTVGYLVDALATMAANESNDFTGQPEGV